MNDEIERDRELAKGEIVLVTLRDDDCCEHVPLAAPGGWSVAKIEAAARAWTDSEREELIEEERVAALAAQAAWIAKNPTGSAPRAWSVETWRPYLSEADRAALPKVRPWPTPDVFVEKVLIARHGFARAQLPEALL